MEQRELQKLLNQPYKQENWKTIVQDVFPNVQLLQTPKVFPIDNPKIEKFSQLGSVKLNDGKSLALFELLLNDSVNLSKNRVELNNEISRFIDQDSIHGVLSVFEQGNEDYRFTFSAKSTDFDENEGDFVTKKTNTKRYTYVLGKNESCRTAAQRFHQLSLKKMEAKINDIQHAFSVEQLSKEFFTKYTNQYNKFWKYIKNTPELANLFPHTDKEKQEIKIRDFTKKLLGRIVFLHFLQKKGWMGCIPTTEAWVNGDKQFMQNLFLNFNHKEKFHSECLYQLFYKTLNTKRENSIFKLEGLSQLSNTKIPYLNGGLFDTDKKKSKEIDFPIEYFETLFSFFGEYNFTIDENDPNEHEVGIDPEMLGHIFENLLEDNKDKGAFYTPKAIVQYMCQESLIEYLKTSLNLEEDDKVKAEAVELLIRDDLAESISNFDLVAPIAKALYTVKICDPAIGSGAFPMGILNEIYQAVESLHFLQPDVVAPIWEISETEWQPHLVKKNIIQHSIYGVDIESGAVDIARLRFWLALIVDEIEPLPLPNLDYKIMQGNSLLESFEGIDLSQISNAEAYESEFENTQIDLFTGEAKKSVKISLKFEDIEALMELYFNSSDPDEKKEIHNDIDEQVINHIRYTLSEYRKSIAPRVTKLQKDIRNKEANAATYQQKEKIRTESKDAKELTKLNKQLNELSKKEIALGKLSNSNERPFFLWHLFFKEVFDNGGFDIVIGNPPYIQIQKLASEEKHKLKEAGFSTFSLTSDIYCVFYEKGINLLKNNGTLSYITSNSWMKTIYGKHLRNFFVNQFNPNKLLNFEDTQIFPSATVEVNILIGNKQPYNYSTKSTAFKKDSLGKPIHKHFIQNYIDLTNLNESEWIILSKENFKIKSKIEKDKLTIGELNYNINIGINTGLNEVFIIDELQKNEFIQKDINNKNLLVPLLRGRDVQKYSYKFDNKYLINANNGLKKRNIPPVNIERNYPIVFQYFQTHRPRLEARWDQGENWYNLRNCAYLEDFGKEKIIWGELSDKPKFTYDNEKFFLDATIFLMTGDNLKSILSIMNSYLGDWYFNQISTTSGVGTNRWKKYKIVKFPIPFLTKNVITYFEQMTDEVRLLKKQNSSSLQQEQKIDNLVYKLYNLTFEDILIIEPEFSERMSKEEYEVFTIE